MAFIRILILILMFVLITSVSYYVIIRYFTARRLANRLNNVRIDKINEYNPVHSRLEIFAEKVLGKLIRYSMPAEEWENSPIRMRFMSAGYYRELDALVFFSLKTSLTLMLPLLFILIALIGHFFSSFLTTLSVAFLLSALGYYAPDVWLYKKIKDRKQEIFESLPNALDLMRVCVNAGLGLDAAIERVGKELQIESVALAREFQILNLELRTGATRNSALKNLADRTGVDDVHALVSMLLQTEHFGTSVAEALRVHSESLREKRALLAQEIAAKIPVKMTIPLILCIFPALMMVLLGPAVITIGKTLTPVFDGVAR